ncbi:MAG: hypothetical protein ACTHMZ_08945 [Actinomycetes bacterium]
MFGRDKNAAGGGSPDPSSADGYLTFLTADDASRLRGLVREAFAEQGLEVTVYDDRVEDSDGRQFGLWNVAAAAHNDDGGPNAWPKVVRQHVRAILAGMDGTNPFEELTRESAEERTYARIYDRAGLPPDIDRFPHVEFAPGLVTMLALDLPETVAVYRREDAERLGGWQRLHDAGLVNLRREEPQEATRVEINQGGHLWVLAGESVYTASRALLLPELAATLGDERDEGNGWLLALPNRHQLAWHVINGPSVIAAMQGLVNFAQQGYSDSPGPLSPHLYWWNGTGYDQLTQYDDKGNPHVYLTAEFQDVLERVTP